MHISRIIEAAWLGCPRPPTLHAAAADLVVEERVDA
jgi:hypothetical protein